jgi:mono/diheme cytochrome c family protein
MLKPLLIASAVLSFSFLAVLAQNQAPANPPAGGEYKIPPEASSQPNPVKPTPESLADGKKMYNLDCAMCHGEKGDGKGDMAGDMKTKMPDFTDPESLKNRTDGDLYYIIKNGKGEMPPEGDRGKPTMLWDIVNYVRALAKK